MRALATTLPLIALSLAGVTACGGDDGETIETAAPRVPPTTATLTEIETDDALTADWSIAPSGDAYVGPTPEGWCLVDLGNGDDGDGGRRCVQAEAQEDAYDGLRWRADESAIVVVEGAQDAISIIDFGEATSVETDLDRHRIRGWSADGESLVGYAIETPDQISRIDPTSLEAFKIADNPPDAFVLTMTWVRDDLIVAGDPGGPGIVVIDPDDGDVERIDAGISELEILSVDRFGRIVTAQDDDVVHGAGEDDDPGLLVIDVERRAVLDIDVPFVDDSTSDVVFITPDGTLLIAIDGGFDTDRMTLHAARIDVDAGTAEPWVELADWADDDPLAPLRDEFAVTDTGLVWIAENGNLVRVDVS